MFFKKFKRAACIALALCFAIMMLTLTTGATTRMRPSYSREADTDNTLGGSSNGNESPIDSTGAGTGEFGDDTSNMGDSATDTTDDMRDTADSGANSNNDDMSNIDSSPDGVIDRVDEGVIDEVVDDARGGMGVWGVVIVIAIIAAIAVLVFAFFPRRK